MKAVDRPFTQIVNGTTQFIIPIFQRDYRWSEDDCERLWQDVVRVGSDQDAASHFIGSIVYIASGDMSAGFTRWLLVDGQQRVTTLTLLIAALRDHIQESGWTADGEDGPTAKRLDHYFLRNLHEEGSRVPKLVLRRRDDATLRAIANGSERPEKFSESVQENYDRFRELLVSADPAVVYRGIGKLVVVDVTLDRRTDDPQMVFESLNSTGVDLSQTDLIRNFLLMALPEKEQTRLYEEYWQKIEALFRRGSSVFDSFVRDYMALKTKATKQVRSSEIYTSFQQYFRDAGGEQDREPILADMLKFARYHARFSLGAKKDDAGGTELGRLRWLAETSAILCMRLSECRATGAMSDADFEEALGLIESYVLRRAVCGAQTRGYWAVFSRLAYRVDDEKPLESLKVAFKRRTGSYAFPGDTEFRTAIQTRDLYRMRPCHYILTRLENHKTKEPTDTSSYTVEHVLPQNTQPNESWRDMLGENWAEVQETWVHRLGNLTLTGYNSEYSDRPFDEKKSIKGGFNESAVRLNKQIRDQDTWSESQIKARGEALAEVACEAWPRLEVDAALVRDAELADLRVRAGRRTLVDLSMSKTAREVLDALSARVRALHPDIVELVERKSVSYHGPEFFLEVLPRKHHVTMLVDVDFADAVALSPKAKDSENYKFFPNARYSAATYCSLRTAAEVDQIMDLVEYARTEA